MAQVLIIDPAPQREHLVNGFRERGMQCAVAHGVHDAMVQCLMRNPDLVVADLSLPGNGGAECVRRLRSIPHFRDTPILTIGDHDPELPASVGNARVIEMALDQLPTPFHPATTGETASVHLATDSTPQPTDTPGPMDAPEPISAPPAPEPHAGTDAGQVAERLLQLQSSREDATVVVVQPDGMFGEVMVRAGTPVHAVTRDGKTGPVALADILAWPDVRVESGPLPRDETPVTLPPTPLRTVGTPSQPHTGTANPAQPDAASPPHNDVDVAALLAELEALGIVQRDTP